MLRPETLVDHIQQRVLRAQRRLFDRAVFSHQRKVRQMCGRVQEVSEYNREREDGLRVHRENTEGPAREHTRRDRDRDRDARGRRSKSRYDLEVPPSTRED